MEDQYGMSDLRQYIGSRPIFPPAPPDHHRGLNPYDMLIFRSDSTTTTTNAAAAAAAGGFDQSGGTGRWPRQETLTLLDIRSRLDPKFKDANHKGPLWDEVSRIMCEEHGYERSGKKCREKFENLYKYYKKTKEGKTGRQDGKHYRFFRQLEALYGETNVNPPPPPPPPPPNYKNSERSLSVSEEAEGDSSSSEDELKNWSSGKMKMREFIDTQMKKVMEKQEVWMERMMRSIEDKERERMAREEEWRKQDAARVEREHKFWANERAWIEARDAALMEALSKITGKENEDGSDQTMADSINVWPACEVQVSRGAMEEERSGIIMSSRKDKWDNVMNNHNNYLLKKLGRGGGGGGGVNYYEEEISNQGQVYPPNDHDHGNRDAPSSNGNGGMSDSSSSFRYFMGDAAAAAAYARIMD